MKQEAGKKKWLLPVIIGAVVLLIAAAVGLFFLLGGNGGEAGKKDPSSELKSNVYWNIDRKAFLDKETSLSNREPDADGVYHIRFAVGGKQKELLCSDKDLVDRIDTLDCMKPQLDSNGKITGVQEIKDFATLTADGHYIRKIDGNKLIVNSSAALNGMDTELTLTDKIGIYDVSTTDENCGKQTTLGVMDRVIVISDAEGTKITDILVNERPVDADVYWRIDKYYSFVDTYSSSEKKTKRVPDENGVYTILMACNGEQVEVKCKDIEIVNKIDAQAINDTAIGLVMDKDGYAVQWTTPAKALRGTAKLNQFDVTAIDGDMVTFQRMLPGSNMGAEETLKLASDCHIYDTTGVSGYEGIEVEELKLGDRVYLMGNPDGEASYIWITNRMTDMPLYFLVERLWDSNTNETSMQPDAEGWYVTKVIGEGKYTTVKTKDKELTNQIHKGSVRVVALKVEDGIIKEFQHYTRVSGGWQYSFGNLVESLTGSMLSTVNSKGVTTNMVLAADCKIYNCDVNNAKVPGEETTLKKGDKVTPIRNSQGEIMCIYITQRAK